MRTDLTPEMVRAGRALADALAELGREPTALLWFFDDDAGEWRLLVEIPDYPQTGPRDTYRHIQEALETVDGELRVALSTISAVDSDNSTLKLLRSALQLRGGWGGMRFAGNVINGKYIEDAYVYRL